MLGGTCDRAILMAPTNQRTPCNCSLSGGARRCYPLRTPCTGSLCGCAGRCPLPRNPCTGSSSDCAGRCPPLRTPCICSFADCARTAPTSPHVLASLVLASLPRCPLPRLRLAPPACCCPLLNLLSAPSPPCCRMNHPSALIGLPVYSPASFTTAILVAAPKASPC